MKCLAKTVFLLLCILTLNCYAKGKSTGITDKLLEEMKQLQREYSLPSISTSIGQNEDVIFAKAIGFRDVEKNQKANASTQYSIGSIAKAMTGLVLVKLVDEGKIDLDISVASYIKELRYKEKFTVRQLAAHTAGIPHGTPERGIYEYQDVRDHHSPFDVFDAFQKHSLLFKPGSDFKYSSNGYILLSAVIEKITKRNYIDVMSSELWQEFGMDSTEHDVSTAGKDHEASYYFGVDEKGKFLDAVSPRDRSFLFGGGGFISTPTDLVKMAQALYDSSFISEKTKTEMLTPVKLDNGNANPQNYTMGWRRGDLLLENDQKWLTLHHGGVTDKAATAYLFVLPECKASIAFATNTLPDKFWLIRARMEELLIKTIDTKKCKPFSV